MKGADLKLEFFRYIDPKYLFEAENNSKQYMKDTEFAIQCKGRIELAIIPESKMDGVKKQYETIGKVYSGIVAEIMHEMCIMEEKHKTEIANKNIEIANQNTKIAQLEAELAKKDLIIYKLETENRKLLKAKHKKSTK